MFTNMYELATKYYEYHGNLAIPQRFLTLNGYEYNKDGIALGRWLVNQRQFYKRNELADERIKLLENIGIEWNGKNINKWNEILALARNYLNYFGDLKVPVNFKTKNGYEYDENGYNLYKWLINQKSLFREGKLSQEKIQKLNDINIHWPSYLKRSKTWNDMYELATKYYKHYGNLEVDKKFKTNDGINYCEDGLNLGMWLVFQIYKYKNNNLSIKKIRLLEEININWDILYRKEYWNKMYELAKKNYEHFGKLTVPAKFKTINGYEYNDEGYDLGKWVSNQKINYKWNRLCDEHRKLIEDLFSPSKLLNGKASFADRWNFMYSLASNYFEHYKNLYVEEGFKTSNGYEYDEKGLDLYNWLYITQVREYKNNKMSCDRMLSKLCHIFCKKI